MNSFIELTRHGAGRKVTVNAVAIAYFDECTGGATVVFGSGAALRVAETPEQIRAALAKIFKVSKP